MALVQAGLVLIPLLWIAARLRVLARNYRAARATGLPFVVCPYDPEGFVFALIQEPLRPVLRRLLPAAAFDVYELSLWGWEFRAKAAVHKRYGPAFVVVTTGLNRLVCADPAMAHTILARRKDFVHPDINLKTMGFLGSNIITNNDEAWSRQRRIVAPALNERVSPDVWKESIDQASSLAGLLCASDSTVETIAGLRVIAIDVLTRIAYGRHKPLTLALPSHDPSADMSYVDAIHLCTEQILLASFVPSWFLRLPFMPRLLRTVGVALERLPGLTRDMLDQERRRSSSAALVADETTTAGLNNSPEIIMSTLIRLSDQEKELTEKGTPDEKTSIAGGNRTSKSYLTEEEIAGNLFIFTAAGFDTTANTMAYAVTLLAACPEWQAWIQAEIDAVLGAPAPGARGHELPVPDYATAFPKLTRCMAVMLETLRLYPPATMVMRATAATQAVPLGHSSPPASSFTLRGPCAAHVNIMALHTSPASWGSDALEFNPARWIRSVSGAQGEPVEELVTPPRGVFMPWSAGPRVCPGQKMSQVEFVAVISTLFRSCSAQPVQVAGESAQQARRRLLDLAQDSHAVLTLQISKPRDARLRWTRRA
ncbi:hypothetical protein RB595_004870 [Gaeumannomyces hyphopodioides]